MKYLIIVLVILTTFNSTSQTYNSLSVDGNIGFNSALTPFAEEYQSNYLGLYHADANIRWMLSNKFGMMWGLGFDRIKSDDLGNFQSDNYFKVHYIRTSFQAVFNIGRIAEFEEIHPRMGLLLHGGFGFASLKDAHRSVWFGDWKTQGSDEMMHLLIGFTPQAKLTKYLSVNVDFTFVGNIWQTKTWDFSTPYEFHKGIDGKIATFSAGVSYYFGRNGSEREHLDWVWDEKSTFSGVQPGDTLIQRETIRTIETIRVVDGDTLNFEKKSANPAGYGPNEDFDGDGVLNAKDACPTTPGDDENGCPNADKDGDGIVNTLDNCPEIKGTLDNNGCPPLDHTTKQILNEGMREVKFEDGNDQLIETSNEHLDKIAQLLADHPEYKLQIDGHTDNSKESGPSLVLSKARADKVKEYLLSKGVENSRMQTEGYGDTKPIAYNDSPSGREQNMRIEFTIEF